MDAGSGLLGQVPSGTAIQESTQSEIVWIEKGRRECKERCSFELSWGALDILLSFCTDAPQDACAYIGFWLRQMQYSRCKNQSMQEQNIKFHSQRYILTFG